MIKTHATLCIFMLTTITTVPTIVNTTTTATVHTIANSTTIFGLFNETLGS
jgi:hypothetical protein